MLNNNTRQTISIQTRHYTNTNKTKQKYNLYVLKFGLKMVISQKVVNMVIVKTTKTA